MHYNKDIQIQVRNILEPFKRADEWKALQIPNQPLPTASVLLTGLSGTGKTTLAFDILKKASKLPKDKIPCLTMGDVASEKLGQIEKAVISAFLDAKNRCKSTAKPRGEVPVIFLDECDAIVWNRDRVSDASMFMLSVVNTLLIQIDRFMESGGLIVFATNHLNLLDAAFSRRITDHITLKPPIGEDAKKVWQSLMPPAPFGFEVTDEICSMSLTPNDIQKFILRECRAAFAEKRNMLIENFV